MAPVIRVTVARGKIRVRDNGRRHPARDRRLDPRFHHPHVVPRGVHRTRQGPPGQRAQDHARHAVCSERRRWPHRDRRPRHPPRDQLPGRSDRPEAGHRPPSACLAPVRIGTSITVHWPGSASSILEQAGEQFLPLVSRFTDLNPHLTLFATWLDGERRVHWSWPAVDPRWTKWTPSAPTSPHWYRVGHLERLAGAFLSHDRERKTVRVLRDFLAEFDGLSGTGKRKAVLEAVGLQRAPLVQPAAAGPRRVRP